MQGLPVQCPQCKRKSFVTTEHFKPDVPPNGSMLKSTLQYQHDWLCTSSTKGPELTCPECLAPLAPGGVLNVLVPIRDVGEFCREEDALIPAWQSDGGGQGTEDASGILDDLFNKMSSGDGLPTVGKNKNIGGKWGDSIIAPVPNVGKPVHICEICGKECSTALALNGHKRSHKK